MCRRQIFEDPGFTGKLCPKTVSNEIKNPFLPQKNRRFSSSNPFLPCFKQNPDPLSGISVAKIPPVPAAHTYLTLQGSSPPPGAGRRMHFRDVSTCGVCMCFCVCGFVKKFWRVIQNYFQLKKQVPQTLPHILPHILPHMGYPTLWPDPFRGLFGSNALDNYSLQITFLP